MKVSDRLAEYHKREAAVATSLYIDGLTNPQAATDWHKANLQARRDTVAALKASSYLTDISGALQLNGAHNRVFRHILAPPVSQDQFKLLCPIYSKAKENRGTPMSKAEADAVAKTISISRNHRLTKWLDRTTKPRPAEIRALLHTVAPLLSYQSVATMRRNHLAAQQEREVIELLAGKGWQQLSAGVIQTLTDVPTKHFAHKTRFATTTLPQEVDIACGMGQTVVLAMECKVTNDQTNSVKRVNDVLKKAKAWQDHWGSFVQTAALLQGVIAYKDVNRLLAANVKVFWSHRLDDFSAWIDQNTKP